MGKINLLDISVANLIAAGEVVDRPASVIKELMENSIDARATEITVEIKNGGITLMRVSDNGCGMERDDAALCISRHATSKIATAKDLDGIVTLGFRGEAMAAIAAVSSLRIMTKRKEDLTGTLVKAECGNVTEISDAGCRNGTTVIVEDLFRNVPARRKFLKRDVSEAMAITAVVEKIALSRPDIAIRLISDNQSKMATAGDGKLENAIYAVLGRDFAKRLIPVHDLTGGIEVNGFIGRPDNVRANRNYQNFFINGRYIKSRTASAALEQAFSSYLESERFPCCVLGIKIHPSSVDVNVHPTKLEVKFSNERLVFDAVYSAVRNALISSVDRPEMNLQKREKATIPPSAAFAPVYDPADKEAKPSQTQLAEIQPSRTSFSIEKEQRASASLTAFSNAADQFISQMKKEDGNAARSGFAASNDYPFPFMDRSAAPTEPKSTSAAPVSANPVKNEPCTEENVPSTVETPPTLPAETSSNVSESIPAPAADDTLSTSTTEFRILGLAFSIYIIVEIGQKLLMIDKHAAHERILFEKMKKNMHSRQKFSQLLLVPMEQSLSPEEISAAALYGKEIAAIGFEFTLQDKKAIFTQLPGNISTEEALDLFVEMTGRLASGTGDAAVSGDIAFEKALYQASCKAAIKGGQSEDPAHLQYIVQKLLSIPNLRYCPHGRPVAFEISKGSIEHQFKRS